MLVLDLDGDAVGEDLAMKTMHPDADVTFERQPQHASWTQGMELRAWGASISFRVNGVELMRLDKGGLVEIQGVRPLCDARENTLAVEAIGCLRGFLLWLRHADHPLGQPIHLHANNGASIHFLSSTRCLTLSPGPFPLLYDGERTTPRAFALNFLRFILGEDAV